MLQGSVALFCYGVMKGFRENLSWIWNTLCGVSSVVSLGLLIFGNEHAVIIALSVFILCLVSLSIVLIRAVNSYFNATSDTDHNRIYIKSTPSSADKSWVQMVWNKVAQNQFRSSGVELYSKRCYGGRFRYCMPEV